MVPSSRPPACGQGIPQAVHQARGIAVLTPPTTVESPACGPIVPLVAPTSRARPWTGLRPARAIGKRKLVSA